MAKQPTIKRYAVSVVRTVTYVEVVTVDAEDEDYAKDGAMEKVKGLKTDGSTFKLMGQRDEVGQVLDVTV